MPNWDRLSAMDASFLGVEDESHQMHVALLMRFEPGSFLDGQRLHIDRIRAFVESRLHLVPRLRQRIMFGRRDRHPVWVDDTRFNIDYHVRASALPYPGGDAELRDLTARVVSQLLDRSKPLWEMRFVAGYHDGSLIVILKVHHCMVDGVGGMDVLQAVLSPTRETELVRAPLWQPRPAPHRTLLTADAALQRIERPLSTLLSGAKAIRRPRQTLNTVRKHAENFVSLAAPGLHISSRTPLNGALGPHRRFHWVEMELPHVKAVKDALQGTVNDVVLATVAGALRLFFHQREFHLPGLDVRALIPVNARTGQENDADLHNVVSSMIAPLPVGMHDPVKRLRAVAGHTQRLKSGNQVAGIGELMAMADWAAPNLIVGAMRYAARLRSYNLIVTNVPGPQLPLYLHDAQLIASYPLVPLFPNQGLGIALLSYNGKLCWGLNGDRDMLHDLHLVEDCVREAFRELQQAAVAAESNGDAAVPTGTDSRARPASARRRGRSRHVAIQRSPENRTGT